MKYLIIYLFLLNSAFFYSKFFEKRIEQTIFLSFLLKILILYLSGLVGTFKIGLYIIYIFNIIYFIKNIFEIFKNKIKMKEVFETSGIIIFTFLYAFCVIISNERIASVWDEFTHWALVVKNMFYLNNLAIGGDSTVVATSYLSGTSIFQYFIMKLYGTFNEGIMYLGQNLLLISIILPIFRNFSLKSFKSLNIYITLFITLFLCSLSYWNLYTSLYVDCMLGYSFFNFIYSYYTLEDGKFKFIQLLCSSIFIIFVKDFGLILFLLGIFIITIDKIFIKNKFNIKKTIKLLKEPLIYLISGLFIKITWLMYVSNHTDATINKTSTGLLKTILMLPKLVNNDSWQETTIKNFINETYYGNIIYFMIRISYIGIIVLFMLLMYNLYKKDKLDNENIKKSYKWLTFSLVIGAFGYAFTLLICYLGVFGADEAVKIASYSRYMNSYVVALIMISVYLLLFKYRKDSNEIQKICLICLFVLISSMEPQSIYSITIGLNSGKNKNYELINKYKTDEEKIMKTVKKNERIYIISTNTDGFDYWVLRYVFTPNKTNLENVGWSLGKKYSESDIYTKDIQSQEWMKILIDNYDYVYLYKVDEKFSKSYQVLFNENVTNRQLYKIDKKNKRLILVN